MEYLWHGDCGGASSSEKSMQWIILRQIGGAVHSSVDASCWSHQILILISANIEASLLDLKTDSTKHTKWICFDSVIYSAVRMTNIYSSMNKRVNSQKNKVNPVASNQLNANQSIWMCLNRIGYLHRNSFWVGIPAIILTEDGGLMAPSFCLFSSLHELANRLMRIQRGSKIGYGIPYYLRTYTYKWSRSIQMCQQHTFRLSHIFWQISVAIVESS